MNKSGRLDDFMAGMALRSIQGFDPCYLAYFECFNNQMYYEAHDVLEHLWLREGRDALNHDFHKGLIQLAGSFVHLKLQYAHPEHPKHRGRLKPARRLFLRAIDHIAPYGEYHQGLDLIAPLTLARSFAELLERGNHSFNPWSPDRAPLLPVPGTIH